MPKLEPYSRALDYTYVPGIFPAMQCLLHRPMACRRLLLHSGAQEGEGLRRLIDGCEERGIRVEWADRVIAREARRDSCQAMMVYEKGEQALSGARAHVVLHHPQDAGNLGTILRTCLGFGYDQLAIIRPAVDAFDPHVMRASMGAVASMALHHYEDMEAYLSMYPGHRQYLFMLRGAIGLEEAAAKASMPFSLVFGNEASGLPDDFGRYGTPVRIHHNEKIDSLNLSIAVGIGAYAFGGREE